MEKEEEESKEISVYHGRRDRDGLPHGRGTLTFIDTGVRFEGRFSKGEKVGRGCFHFPDNSSLTGTYINDELEGKGVYRYSDGREMVAEYMNGELCGPFVEYDYAGNIAVRGRHRGNKRVGVVQIFDEYGGVLWGVVDREECLSGSEITYVYPDLKHVLHGRFTDGILNTARSGILINSVNDLSPKLKLGSSKVLVSRDESTHDVISQFPLRSDLYECDKVYVSNLTIANAGQGLFSKKAIEIDTIVSFYNGIRLMHNEVDSRDWSLNDCTITLDEETVLDVPPSLTDLDKYCATLGHKANHSGTPNCEYVFFDHPRFGEIKAIKTISDVERDEELTCDYGYCHKIAGTDEDDLPAWFKHTSISQ